MILVFGSSGQVASDLKPLLPGALFIGRSQLDLSDPKGVKQVIRDNRPRAIINAAAYTAVDQAEDEEETAFKINAAAPSEMAEAAQELKIPMVHLSTDYVFNGTGERAYRPHDPTDPLGAYGRTKLAGEQAVANSGACAVILRTSWVFSEHGSNFLKTMLRLSQSRDHLSIVADQVGGPTPSHSIAKACIRIANAVLEAPEKAGIYHFSGQPDVSWADFARKIFQMAGREVAVEDIPSAQYPTKAERPANSRLDCSTLSVFGLERPDWTAGVRSCLTKMDIT